MEIGPDSSNENGGRCPRPQLLKEVPFLENTSAQNNFHSSKENKLRKMWMELRNVVSPLT